jgi:hypothetical protein
MKRMITFLMISFLVLSFNTLVFAKDDSSGNPSVYEVMGDVLWIRPIGFIQTGLGGVAYVISLPVTIPLKKTDEAKEFLITFPYNYYFKRPLGKM